MSFENEQALNKKMDSASKVESEKFIESVEKKKEEEAYKGAEILENPPEGSFVQGLQIFVAWVKNLLANDKKN